MVARLLILVTLAVNIIGWVACLRSIDAAVVVGLLNGLLGLILSIVGLIGGYGWAGLIGLAHFVLPFVMFSMVAVSSMGPLRARPAFLWLDAVFLAAIVPASIIAWLRGSAIGRFEGLGVCQGCGYVLHGLTEPRCPECGQAFDPSVLRQGLTDRADAKPGRGDGDQEGSRMPECCLMCRTRLLENSRFCHHCGAPVAGRRPRQSGSARWCSLARRALWVGWALCVLGCVLAALVSIKTICFMGPLISAVGLFTLAAGRVSRHRSVYLPALVNCLFCLFVLGLIVVLRWSPRRARLPVLTMGCLYTAASTPLVVWAYRKRPLARSPWECRACGYLLYGLTAARCPECGTPFDPQLLDQSGPPGDTPAPEPR